MEEVDVLLIQGWATSDRPVTVIAELLGHARQSFPIRVRYGAWEVADRVPEDEPIGRLRSMMAFTVADGRSSVSITIVPGSQGCEEPAGEIGGLAKVVRLRPTSCLLLDARCWYRIDSGPAVQELHFGLPSALVSSSGGMSV